MDELTAVVRQISESLLQMEERLEERTTTVSTTCARWEAALSERLAQGQELLTSLEALEKRLRWRRRTIATTAVVGFLAGLGFLLAALTVPGVNSLMYRLILVLGR
jgi:DUF917 family protein